jgi:hypothetical protein
MLSDEARPVDRVAVEIWAFAGGIGAMVFIDGTEHFEVGSLPPGTYYVVVKESGYEPVQESVHVSNSRRI